MYSRIRVDFEHHAEYFGEMRRVVAMFVTKEKAHRNDPYPWCYGYDPETKRQCREWKSPDSPSQKNLSGETESSSVHAVNQAFYQQVLKMQKLSRTKSRK